MRTTTTSLCHVLLTFGLLVNLFVDLTQCQENNLERRVRELVNIERQKAGLQPLAYNQQLFEVSRGYAETMARGNFFSHIGQDGSSPLDRPARAGYTGQVNENIAKGQSTAESVVQDWMGSPSHRANIMNPIYNEIGVGVSSAGWLWVQTFGSRRGAPPANAPAPAPAHAPARVPAPAPAPAPVVINPNRPSPSNGVSIFYFQGSNFQQFRTKTWGAISIQNPSGQPFVIEGHTIPGSQFSVKMIGSFRAPSTGTYRFQTLSDDGIILDVGGIRCVNNWSDHSLTTDTSGPITLTANTLYQIKLHYYNNVGGGTLVVNYQGPGMSRFEQIPNHLLTPDNAAGPYTF